MPPPRPPTPRGRARTARPSRSTSSHCGTSDGTTPAGRAALLELLSEELYLTDRLNGAIAARTQALELRRELGDVVAVGTGHRALSLFEWYAAERRTAEREDDAAISILSGAGEPRALGFALANRAYLAACAGRPGEGPVRRAVTRSGSPTSSATPACAAAASLGVALVGLYGGDHACPVRPASRPATTGCGYGLTSWRPCR